MTDALASFFDSSDFPARWHCGNWSAALGWTHISADLAIFAAYAAIPVAIAYFVRRRRDVTFSPLYWLFAAFIFSCGFGHLIDAGLFWSPQYRLAGAVKVCTALASWATVAGLVHILPLALTLPGAARLNEQLRQEIDERRRAEDEVRRLNLALRDRVEELQALFEILPVGIGIASDPQCRDIRPNQALTELLRLPPAANASKTALGGEAPAHFQVWTDGRETAPDELPMQTSIRERRAVRSVEEEIRFADGTRAIVLSHAVPLFDRAGAVRGAVGAFVDLTPLRAVEAERKLVDQRLLESQKLESLGVLAGGIAHDFNNLLTGILGNASLLRTELPPSSALHDYLQPIEEASTRAADLCRQLLAYAGKGRFVLHQIDLNTVVRETDWLLRSALPERTSLVYDLAAHLPPIVGDAAQLRQVLLNLVTNACEALGGEAGTVSVVTRAEGTDRVAVEVRDTGAGMTPEIVGRIFDPFFTTKFTGRGLGLPAVSGIVRGHRGTLDVRTDPGRGTVFTVLLPCVVDRVDLVARAHPIRKWQGVGKVLVVDDEETIRRTAARILVALGFEVIVAADGLEAIAKFSEQPGEITLVLLDLTMPEVDGEQTFHGLRAVRADVKVLLMSGFNEQDAVERFVGKGLAGFVQKPFGVEELREAVKAQLTAE